MMISRVAISLTSSPDGLAWQRKLRFDFSRLCHHCDIFETVLHVQCEDIDNHN